MLKNVFVDLVNLEEKFSSLYGQYTFGQKERYERCFKRFKEKFNVDSAYIASSPGRVEVCGNHTDHNGGVVLACAISLDTIAFFLPTDDDKIMIESEGYGDICVDLSDLTPKNIANSAEIIRGVAKGVLNMGFKIGGFKAVISSNVKGGAGISSSASFEVLIAEIFNFLYNEGKINNETKAIISRYAENVYFGKPCGLLDQTAIAYGGLVKIDFSLENKILIKNVKDNVKDFSLVLINTGGSHEDLTDEYASVPNDMKNVAKSLGKNRLIELSKEDFYAQIPNIKDELSCKAIIRATHFYSENERVNMAVNALEGGNLFEFLKAVNDSGISSLWQLQNCCAVKQEQLIPYALAISKNFINVGASRVHGGGFAGCILCVIKNDEVDYFIDKMRAYYQEEDIIKLAVRESGAIII